MIEPLACEKLVRILIGIDSPNIVNVDVWEWCL